MKKVVLITGGSDGLGRTIAEYLSPDYQVVIISPTKEKVAKVAKEIKSEYFVSDVSNFDSIQKAIKGVIKKIFKN